MPHVGRDAPLEQWIAVSDELAALVRAGIPLAPSLTSVGADLPGRLGDLVVRLGQRLEQGQSLGEALAAEPGRFPPVLTAVVQAGMRADRLPAALESLAESARRLAEMRQTIYAALLYPLFLLSFGYGLFVVFLWASVPRLHAAFAAFRLRTNWGLETLSALGESVRYWGAVPPIVLLVVLLAWLPSRRAPILAAPLLWPFRFLPHVRRLASDSVMAVFAELLGMLLEHEATLPESLRLAAQSTADKRLSRAADRLAAGIERGTPARALFDECADLPPFLRCLLLSNRTSGRAKSLKQAARLYRERLAWRAQWLRLVLPIGLLVFLGGGATALLAVAILGPFLGLLKELALP